MAAIYSLTGEEAVDLKKQIGSLTHKRYTVHVYLDNKDIRTSLDAHIVISLRTSALDYVFPISSVDRRIHLKHDLRAIEKSLKNSPASSAQRGAHDVVAILQHYSSTIDVGNIASYSILYGLSLTGSLVYRNRLYLKSLFRTNRRLQRFRGYELVSTVATTEEEPIHHYSLEELVEREGLRQQEREYQTELKRAKREIGETGGETLGKFEETGGGGGLGLGKTQTKPPRQKSSTVRKLYKPHTDLSKSNFWRRNKSCKIYDSKDEFKEMIREKFRRGGKPTSLKYREALETLREFGWTPVGTTDHPKMVHESMMPHIKDILYKDPMSHFPDFYNPHKSKEIDLLHWATHVGKRYGPQM